MRNRNSDRDGPRAVREPVRWRAPPAVSRPHLLAGGSDRTCRRLIYNLLALADHLDTCRNIVARKFGVSGPQYSVLMAIARHDDGEGVSADTIARVLNVSPAFITVETGRLIEMGLIAKRRDDGDRRRVSLQVSAEGRVLIDRYAPLVRLMNDTLLGRLDTEEFAALAATVEKLVDTSTRTASFLGQWATDEPVAKSAAL
ncbi:MAG: MarR family transcriptional regulator [Alphaproteobacteria bacterium]|nr:MarR family transcriptional regulator [Alphaproteobacteria bacterium]